MTSLFETFQMYFKKKKEDVVKKESISKSHIIEESGNASLYSPNEWNPLPNNYSKNTEKNRSNSFSISKECRARLKPSEDYNEENTYLKSSLQISSQAAPVLEMLSLFPSLNRRISTNTETEETDHEITPQLNQQSSSQLSPNNSSGKLFDKNLAFRTLASKNATTTKKQKNKKINATDFNVKIVSSKVWKNPRSAFQNRNSEWQDADRLRWAQK